MVLACYGTYPAFIYVNFHKKNVIELLFVWHSLRIEGTHQVERSNVRGAYRGDELLFVLVNKAIQHIVMNNLALECKLYIVAYDIVIDMICKKIEMNHLKVTTYHTYLQQISSVDRALTRLKLGCYYVLSCYFKRKCKDTSTHLKMGTYHAARPTPGGPEVSYNKLTAGRGQQLMPLLLCQ